MSKRTTWKNTPDGRTIRRNVIPKGSQWSWWTVEMLESPAYRALNLSEHRIIARIRLELARHGGRDNGKLPVTFRDFQEYGVRWNSIAPAIRAAEALGWIRVTQHGVASSEAEFRIPTKFALTHLATDDADKAVTNDWQRIKTIEEAEAVAKEARKNPPGGAEFPEPEKHFLDTETVLSLNTETVVINLKFLIPKRYHCLQTKRYHYLCIGVVVGWKSRKRAAKPELACRYWSALTELHQGFFIHPACVEEWQGKAPELTGLMEWSAPVLIEVFGEEAARLRACCEAIEQPQAAE
jgi:hypothetical protein